jgi:hypothetical protein
MVFGVADSPDRHRHILPIVIPLTDSRELEIKRNTRDPVSRSIVSDRLCFPSTELIRMG